MTLIRAPRWERILTVVVLGPLTIATGAVVAAVAFDPGTAASGFVVVLGSALVVPGTWITVRARRVGVSLSDETFRYRGFLLSWSAPRRQITAVLDDAFVEWRDERGVEHRRQVWLLTQVWEDDGTKFAPLWRWRREGLLLIRAWADARAV
ncbi:hypothetical protein DEJ23_05650 [Curtobacterium sp. MCSS17_008]|uniref:hypothetical protein n=1 Tax=Curtobacterium sp. MCSS17_008 TaxID=2175647 RepID=UPI000DA7AB4D|nr:hypothetical protein [Curtobacterium sp. MCSS17_008]PZF58344.1 hypothetical protein DEJ23_05650 [Curtobacterium sp. MCSS17_008]